MGLLFSCAYSFTFTVGSAQGTRATFIYLLSLAGWLRTIRSGQRSSEVGLSNALHSCPVGTSVAEADSLLRICFPV